jgi:hypothetical protein
MCELMRVDFSLHREARKGLTVKQIERGVVSVTSWSNDSAVPAGCIGCFAQQNQFIGLMQ